MWENQRTSKGNLINAITIILIDILCFYFLRLFSDAELREDRSEDFVGSDGTGDGAQMMIDKAELFGQKIGGAAVVEGGEGTDEGFVRSDEGFVVATVGDDGVAVINGRGIDREIGRAHV